MAAFARALLVPALTAMACGATQSARRPASAPAAFLLLECTMPGARVYVDDVFVGLARQLDARPLELAPGARRLEVRADGYFTIYRDLALLPGERHYERVRLRQMPDEDG